MNRADIIGIAIGAAAMSAILVSNFTKPKLPEATKERVCAAYRDIIKAATENGNERLYLNPEFEKLCGGVN